MSTTPPDDAPPPVEFDDYDVPGTFDEDRSEPEPASVSVVTPGPGPGMAIVWCLVFLVAAQVVPALVIGVPVGIYFATTGPEEEVMDRTLVWVMILGGIIEVAFTVWLLRYFVGRDWLRKIAFRWPRFQHLLLGLIALPAIMICTDGIFQLTQMILPSQSDMFNETMEDLFRAVGSFPIWVSILTIAVYPGIAEELFCRAFLGRGLLARLGVWGGILLSSLFFGLLHILPAQVIYAAFMGVFLHAAYYFTRSLWLPILLHFGNNAASAILARDQMTAETTTIDQAAMPLILYPIGAALLAAVGYAVYRSRCRFVSADPDRPAWEPPYPGVMLPPRNSGTVIATPFAGWLAWAGVVLAATGLGIAMAFYPAT